MRDLLLKVLRGEYSEFELEELILELASLLGPIAAKRVYQTIRNEGYTPKDIALLTIAALFVRDEKGRFPVLQKIFSARREWLESVPERDLGVFFRGLLSRRLHETFFALSSEIFPGRTKLRRVLLLALKKNPELSWIKTGTEIWIVPEDFQGDKIQAPIPYERLLEISAKSALWGLQVPKFLTKMISSLEGPESKSPIRLRDIIDIYQAVQGREESGARSIAPEESLYGEKLQAEISSWLQALEEENQKRIDHYVFRNKIPGEEKQLWHSALKAIVKDWLDGGQDYPLYDYLQVLGTAISANAYRNNYRKVFEYLVKTSKTCIREKAETRNCSS